MTVGLAICIGGVQATSDYHDPGDRFPKLERFAAADVGQLRAAWGVPLRLRGEHETSARTRASALYSLRAQSNSRGAEAPETAAWNAVAVSSSAKALST